jgi:hypothetical protein
MGEGEGKGEGGGEVRVRVRVSLFSCIPHPFVCLQVGVCYLFRAFSGVVGVGECLRAEAMACALMRLADHE